MINQKKGWGNTQKRVDQKELIKQLTTILRTKELTEEEEEVLSKAEVLVADFASIKAEIYNAKSIETLTGIVKKYQIEPNCFLADYARRRTVWLKCFDVKNNKATKESAEKLLNKYKGAFRPGDIQKVIDFLNK
jgi:hypothetical protein